MTARPATIDAHVHFTDFFQETQGIERLLVEMRKAGVARAVIAGSPLTKTWDEREPNAPRNFLDDDSRLYYYSYTDAMLASALEQLNRKDRAAFAPLLCGFNPVDRFAIRHIERAYGAHPHLWKGIGEILCRHDDLTRLTEGDPPRPDHPALSPVYAFAAEKNVPVLLHQNITSPGSDRANSYADELKRALHTHPDTRFVWAHCGCSKRVHVTGHAEMVDELLADYPNLFADISWVIFDDVMMHGSIPDPSWVSVIERNNGRFCLGSDLNGTFDTYTEKMRRYRLFLDHLSDKARSDLLFGTASTLYFGEA